MKKISILSLPCILILLLLLLSGHDTKAQDKNKIRSTVEVASANVTKWLNAGKVDSIGLLYLENACMIPDAYREVYGRDNIKGYYQFLYNAGFRFSDCKTKVMIITDSIVFERGTWESGPVTGTFITQWRLSDGKWYIENEMTNSDNSGIN